MNVDTREVEDLLVDLILEGKVEGRIDQAGKRLELDSKYVHHSSSLYWLLINVFHSRQSLEKKRYSALQKWADGLQSIESGILTKTAAGGRPGDPAMMGEMYQDRWS